MARTDIGRIRDTLEEAAQKLKIFEDFRSPVNHAVVVVLWNNKYDDQDLVVAVREDHGTFYRGRITEISRKGNWTVLADDGELVAEVTADMFVSVRLVDRP